IIDAVRVRRILKNEHKIAQKNGYRIFYRKKRKPSDKNEREYERMSENADERPFRAARQAGRDCSCRLFRRFLKKSERWLIFKKLAPSLSLF
ncbi:MAG: hypothetical protein IJM24_00085, partial [Clostridia bacterium]|nr:hypothetical protein [Clostridia bacterium]MBR7061878.1 hypothetical protein [Clostridia bacterium]